MEVTGENEYVDCDGDGVWDAIGACAGRAFDPEKFTVDDSETLIDGTGITAPVPAPVGGASVVRVGRDNTISHVTIRAPRRSPVAGSIDVNLPPTTGGMNAVVSDSILEGGQRGIRCNNGAPALSGIASSATIERNVIRNIQPVPGGLFSFGVQVQNAAATGSSWTVSLRSNRVYASRFGYFIVGNNSRMADTDVFSMRNIIHDNELGIFIAAAFAPAGAPAGDSANDNLVRFNSQEDTIENNVSPAEHLDAFMGTGGGLVALAAGRDSAVAGVCSRNQLRLQLLQTVFSGNLRVDSPRHVTVFGSLSSTIAGPETGTANELRLLMRRTDTDGALGAFLADDSDPDDPIGTNQALVIGSDVAFDHANLGSAQTREIFPGF